MKNKILLLGGFAMLTSVAVTAQNDKEEPYKTQDFAEASLKNLYVETSGGFIDVEGGADKFRVEMYVRPNNWNGRNTLDKKEIEERLENYDVFLGTEGDKVVARAKRKGNLSWNDRNSLSIGFKVYAPTEVSTELKTSGGSITLDGMNGEQNFSTSGGSLKLADLKGKINGNTSGGSITATHCSDDIKLNTSGGSIKVEDLVGNINLSTSGGSLTLVHLNGEVKAETSGGSIRGDGFRGKLETSTSGGSIRLQDISASVRAETSGGGIDVEITTLGDYLELSTSAGNVHVDMALDKGMDLDIKGDRVSMDLKNFDGRADKDRISGKMNGGGVPVQLSSSGGNVTIN